MKAVPGGLCLAGIASALALPTFQEIRTRVSLSSVVAEKPWLFVKSLREDHHAPETSSYSRWPPEPAPQLPMSHPLLRPRYGVQQVHIMQGARPDEVTVEWAEDAMDATPTSLQYRVAACDNTDGTDMNTPFCDQVSNSLIC
jgi:hypothetical protein